MKLITLGSNKTLAIINDRKFFFSYNTCVAYKDPQQSIRVAEPSKTTARHLKEMGVDGFKVVPEYEFQAAITL